MNKFLSVIIASILGASCLMAGENEVSKTVKVVGGSYSITNGINENYCIDTVTFKIPVNWTNTFAITLVRPVYVPGSDITVITTNTFVNSDDLTDVLSTNVYAAGPSLEYTTNVVYSGSTTNNTDTQVISFEYSGIGLPRFIADDVVTFSWSYTNAIYVMIDME
jgi:hypothetical protein